MCKQIYYYCDINGFKGIIENRTLWMSEYHLMNDSTEESLYLDSLATVMRNARDNLSDTTKKFLNEEPDLDRFITGIDRNYTNLAYICCFSNDLGDDLSQWRGYANDGQGLCIGFNKKIMEQLSSDETITKKYLNPKISDQNLNLGKHFIQCNIKYANKEKIIATLEPIISDLMKKFDDKVKKTDKKLSRISAFISMTHELYENAYKHKATYKNSSFRSENEYRICLFDTLHEDALSVSAEALQQHMTASYHFNNGTIISKFKYRTRDNLLIPYRELVFPDDYFMKLLSSVTIGPKNKMSENDIKYFLAYHGFDQTKIEVKKSESTYR